MTDEIKPTAEQVEDLPTMNENEWPVYAVLLKTGELYWHDTSWGNRHGTGEGWLMVLPWGEQRERGGFHRGDNRFGVEHEDVSAFTLLNPICRESSLTAPVGSEEEKAAMECADGKCSGYRTDFSDEELIFHLKKTSIVLARMVRSRDARIKFLEHGLKCRQEAEARTHGIYHESMDKLMVKKDWPIEYVMHDTGTQPDDMMRRMASRAEAAESALAKEKEAREAAEAHLASSMDAVNQELRENGPADVGQYYRDNDAANGVRHLVEIINKKRRDAESALAAKEAEVKALTDRVAGIKLALDGWLDWFKNDSPDKDTDAGHLAWNIFVEAAEKFSYNANPILAARLAEERRPLVEAVKKFLRIDVEGDPTYECGEGVAWNKPCSCRWHRAHDAVRAILAKHTGESNG